MEEVRKEMNCEDTIEFYIKDTKYQMEQTYYQATGKILEWDERNEYMRRMRNLQSLGQGFLDYENQLQLFLEMKGRVRMSKIR
jgi:hypothetical protein